MYPSNPGIPLVIGKIFMNASLENLSQYEMRNARKIASASDSIVITGINISIFDDLLFN